MKGLFYSAGEELGRMYRAIGGGLAFLIFQIVLFALNGYNLLRNSGMALSVFVIYLLPLIWGLYALLRWFSGGEIALERSAGRASWQSMGGKALAWAACLGTAEVLRQLVTWLAAEKDPQQLALMLRIGRKVFTLEDAAPLLGWRACLTAVSVGLLVLLCFALLYAATCRGSGSKLSGGERTIAVVVMCAVFVWIWYDTKLPLWPLCPILVPPVLALCCWALQFWEN